MAFIFRDTYFQEFQRKRKQSANITISREIANRTVQSAYRQQYEQARNAVIDLQTQLNILKQQLSSEQNAVNPDTNRISQLRSEIEILEQQISQTEKQRNQFADKLIFDLIIANKEENGGNLDPVRVGIQYQQQLAQNPDLDPIAFATGVIQNSIVEENTSEGIPGAQRKLSQASERFRNILEGRPDGRQSGLQARDPYAIFEPSVCGLIALDNEGNILNDDKFNIPFQYITDFKDSKSAEYTSTKPFGRFEPHRAYAGAEPYEISFKLGYHAYEQGPNSDEGFIQEVKDRWLASQYPVYGKNQQNGVRSYGTPNKYLLNVFSRYINIPVYIDNVNIDQEFALDPYTFFAMGFEMTVSLKTAYRLAQVVSADDIVTRGLRAYSHKFLI